jgi:hypothetical protein
VIEEAATVGCELLHRPSGLGTHVFKTPSK